MWHVRKNNCHDLRFTFNQRSWNCEQSTRLLRHGLARKTDDCYTLSNIGIPSPKSWSVKNLAAAGSARQRQQPTCGGKVRQVGKKPRVAGFSSVLRPEGSELGRARGGTDGLDGELLQLPAWKPTNTSIPLYPPLQPEMPCRARIGGGGEGCTYLCANITKYSLPLCKYHQILFVFVQISP